MHDGLVTDALDEIPPAGGVRYRGHVTRQQVVEAIHYGSHKVEWPRDGVLCSIERVPGGWLARRNGIPVATGETAALATGFAVGQVPVVMEPGGRWGRPDWSVSGVREAVAALADEAEPMWRGR
jgi:hypothetical protein